MYQRLLAVALLFGVCTPPVHSLRVYSHVYKTNDKKWFGKGGVVQQALEKLEQQWPGGDKSKEMLSAAVYGHPDFDQAVLREKLSKKMHSQEPFIFAAFGSSVSAGHDNFANHSWPLELERILKPTFQALNFDFEMRQRAMGGYGEAPFHGSCLAERAGAGGVDAVAWEFGMFGDAECEHAQFCKGVAAMDSKPALIAFKKTDIKTRWENTSYGGEQERSDLRDKMLSLKNQEGWHSTYHPNDWFFSEDFISNDEAKMYHEAAKKHIKPSGERSMEEEMADWNMPKVAKASNVEGFYAVVPDMGAGFVSNEPWYTAREKAFNINWHPGPLGHKLLASQVAHFILTELKKEIEGVSLSVKAKGPGAGPVAGNPLVGDNAKALDLQCGTMVTQTCRNGIEPSSGGLSAWQSLNSNSQDTWELVQDSNDPNAQTGPQIDQRNAWRGKQSSGEFQFEVEVPFGESQYLLVCGKPCGWHCEPLSGYVSTKSQRWWDENTQPPHPKDVPRKDVSDLAFSVDGVTVAPAELLRLHDQFFDKQEGQYCPGCDKVADLCQPTTKLSAGKHKIGLQVKPSSYNDASMHVDILQYMLVA